MPSRGGRGGGGGGGRGRGRGQKAAPKPAAAKKSAAAPKKAVEIQGPPNGESWAHPDCPDKEINLAVSRYYRTKLKRFDRDDLNKLAGKTTKASVHSYLYNGVKTLRKEKKKYLSTKFWTEFYEEFGLKGQMFAGLESLSTEEAEINPELLEAMLAVRVENPADRKPGPFLLWLEHDDGSASKDEMIVMLLGSVAIDRVSDKHSEEMLTGLHKYIGRHKIHQKFGDVWEYIKDDMDMHLHSLWAKANKPDDERKPWLVAHRYECGTLFDVGTALEVAEKVSVGGVFGCRSGPSDAVVWRGGRAA